MSGRVVFSVSRQNLNRRRQTGAMNMLRGAARVKVFRDSMAHGRRLGSGPTCLKNTPFLYRTIGVFGMNDPPRKIPQTLVAAVLVGI